MIEFEGLRCDFSLHPCGDGDISNDTEACDCFASKPICTNGRDILKSNDFAGCVTLAEILSVMDGDTNAIISTLQSGLMPSRGTR